MIERNKIISIINGITEQDVRMKTSLVTDKIIDSVDLVQIIGEIEETFEISIPFDEMSPENFDSIDAISDLVEKLKSK